MTDTKPRRRIGLLGGTFDPIHLGHLLIGEYAHEQLGLDEVRFIPAAVSPLKQGSAPSDGKKRLEMVQLATGGNPKFTVDDRELKRGGPSFTIDTIEEITGENPDADLFLLMGADSLVDFDSWKSPGKICELACITIIERGGHPPANLEILTKYLPGEPATNSQPGIVVMPQIEISATMIRQRVSEAKSIRYQVHPAVEAFIEAEQLFGSK